jgi:hypothetical protein
MGHEVTVGTRGPEETKSRAEPDAYVVPIMTVRPPVRDGRQC